MKKLVWIAAGALLLSALALALLFMKPWKADSNRKTDSTHASVDTLDIDSQTASIKSGSKTLIYRNRDGDPQWKAVLEGTFLYDGSVAVCTSSVCTVTFYDDHWYTESNVTEISGNTAQVNLTTVVTILGLDVDQKACSISLSCDPDGNLS